MNEVITIKDLNWSVLKSEYVIRDRWISLRADTCRMPSGKIVAPYYVLEYPDWVNAVAITKENEMILVQQYRHGCGKTLLELPSGCMEISDKSPAEAAKRELLEETGYTCKEFIDLGAISANPSNHNNLSHCFLGMDAELVSEPHLDDTEELKVILKPLDEVIEYLKKGGFLQAMHVSALFKALLYMNIIRL